MGVPKGWIPFWWPSPWFYFMASRIVCAPIHIRTSFWDPQTSFSHPYRSQFYSKSWLHRMRKPSADRAMLLPGCSLVNWAQIWKFSIPFLHNHTRSQTSVLVHSADRTFSGLFRMIIILNASMFSCWFVLSLRYHNNTPTGNLRGSKDYFPVYTVPLLDVFLTTCSVYWWWYQTCFLSYDAIHKNGVSNCLTVIDRTQWTPY